MTAGGAQFLSALFQTLLSSGQQPSGEHGGDAADQRSLLAWALVQQQDRPAKRTTPELETLKLGLRPHLLAAAFLPAHRAAAGPATAAHQPPPAAQVQEQLQAQLQTRRALLGRLEGQQLSPSLTSMLGKLAQLGPRQLGSMTTAELAAHCGVNPKSLHKLLAKGRQEASPASQQHPWSTQLSWLDDASILSPVGAEVAAKLAQLPPEQLDSMTVGDMAEHCRCSRKSVDAIFHRARVGSGKPCNFPKVSGPRRIFLQLPPQQRDLAPTKVTRPAPRIC